MKPERVVTRGGLVAVQALACCVLAGWGAIASRSGNPASEYALSCALTVAFVWTLWTWRLLVRTLFDPYGMFIVALFLFNGGQALLEVFGLNQRGVLGGAFDGEVIAATLYMVLLGLSFTHLGALVAIRRRSRPITGTFRYANDPAALRATGWTLLSVSLVPSGYLLWATAATVVSGGYVAAYQVDASAGLAATPQVLSLFIVPASLFLLAGANGRRREKSASVMIIAVSTAVQFALGFRSAAITPACAFLWLWNRCEKRVRTLWLVGAGAALIVAIPLSRETRSLYGSDRVSFEVLRTAYQAIDNPLVSSVSEMGGSMITVAYTYALVPSARGFDYGSGYAYAALTLLPNLFWSVHPTIAHGQASDWLMRTVDPYQAMRGIGLGYSCIAEAYLNFGWLGVPIVMALVGWGAARLAARGAGGGRLDLAMIAACTSFLLKFPRGETSTLIRTVVWYALLPYALTVAISALKSHRSAHQICNGAFSVRPGRG